MKRTLGGDRLGGGKKMKVHMRNYERSTHDLSRAWRSSMSAGTLVPFLKELALPGDTFDIDLNCTVMTLPTLGPLFGTYQVQLDVFLAPIRLYNAKLHMNMLGIGLRMQDIILPKLQVQGINPVPGMTDIDNLHTNPSSLLRYLGIAGLGQAIDGAGDYEDYVLRRFNAIPLLAYWDTYKNYYANKMEEVGMMIHKKPKPADIDLVSVQWFGGEPSPATIDITDPYTETEIDLDPSMYIVITLNDLTDAVPLEAIQLGEKMSGDPTINWRAVNRYFANWEYDIPNNKLIGTTYMKAPVGTLSLWGARYEDDTPLEDTAPTIESFPLENIDNMKIAILQHAGIPIINHEWPGYAPYSNMLDSLIDEADPAKSRFSIQYTQEGLGLRTYKSDLFNNWLNTEFIDGENGINEITKVDTATSGGFTIDELNMSKKLYDMLNRIAISGGTYDDWLDAVYTEDRTRSAENPMYMGGLIQDLVFQEVISVASTENTPLGQLAGRGKTGEFHKGGKVIIKVDEPSYIMGIVSIVPNIDYSQGNDWDVNLRTMNDLHKPALDEIGFQDLVTEQMAWWDAVSTSAEAITYHSAGKQPAWINYMTAVNRVYGTFADANQQMFMVLARRYEVQSVPEGQEPDIMLGASRIKDLTTYVDPSKFNHIFADTRIDAQNFWVQIGLGIEARRKMSAKIIPNL